MPIQVACACGKTYTFKDQDAGRQVKCPACGQAMRVPGHAAARPAHEEETGRRFSRAEVVAFAVAGGAVLALAIIIPAFFIYGGAKPLAPKEPAAKTAVAAAPAEKPAAPAAKTPAEKPPAETPAAPAQPVAPAEKTPAETPPAPPEKTPAKPGPRGFTVEPFDPAALKAGQYAGRTVCWKGQVIAIKSAQPGIVSVLVYEQGAERVEAELRFRGNLIAGVGTGKTIVFEGKVERPPSGAAAEGAPALVLTNVRIDLAALAAEMAAPPAPAETPAAPSEPAPPAPAEKAPAETPATPAEAAPAAPAQPAPPP